MGFMDFLAWAFAPRMIALPPLSSLKPTIQVAPPATPVFGPNLSPGVALPPFVFTTPVVVTRIEADPSLTHGVGLRVDHFVRMGASQANAVKYVGYFNEACMRFEINNHARICAFIAQTFEESGNLSVTEENLHYSAERLHQVWPSRFPTMDSALAVASAGPEAIANTVYGGRLGNAGNEGYKYRGRGFIQLTFKGNYELSGKNLGVDLVANPDLVSAPEYAALTAAEYWYRSGCNHMSDPDDEDSVIAVTRRVNGGLINIDTRIANWRRAEQVFSDLK